MSKKDEIGKVDVRALEDAEGNPGAASDESLLEWLQEAVQSLSSVESKEATVIDGNTHLQAAPGERIDARKASSVVMRDGGFLKLSGHASGTVESGAVVATDWSNVCVKGDSQVFLHGNATAELYGVKVFGFADGHSSVVARDAKVVAAGRASVRAVGGWVGVKDEAVAHVKDGAVEVAGRAVVIAGGSANISARGGTVLVESADVSIAIKSPEARVVFLNALAEQAKITGDYGADQVHPEKSIALLEALNELNFRELMHKEQAPSKRAEGNREVDRRRVLAGIACSPDEEATRLASKLMKATLAEEVQELIEKLKQLGRDNTVELAGRYLRHLESAFGEQGASLDQAMDRAAQKSGALITDDVRQLICRELEALVGRDFDLQAARVGRQFQSAKSAIEVAKAYLHLTVLARNNPFARHVLNVALGQELTSLQSGESCSDDSSFVQGKSACEIGKFGMAVRTAVANDLVALPVEIRDAQCRVRRVVEQMSAKQAQAAAETFARTGDAGEALAMLRELERLLREMNPYVAEYVKNATGKEDLKEQEKVLDEWKAALEKAWIENQKSLPRPIRDAQCGILTDADERVMEGLAEQLLKETDSSKIQELLGKLDQAQLGSRAASHIMDKLAESRKHYERVMIGQGTGLRVAEAIRVHLKSVAVKAVEEIVNAESGEAVCRALDKLWAQRKSVYSEGSRYLAMLGVQDARSLDELQNKLADGGNTALNAVAMEQVKSRLKTVLEGDKRELAADSANQVVSALTIQTGRQAIEALLELSEKNVYARSYCDLISAKQLLPALSTVKRSDTVAADAALLQLRAVQSNLTVAVSQFYKDQALAAVQPIMVAETAQAGVDVVQHLLEMFAANKPAALFVERLGLGPDRLTELYAQLMTGAMDRTGLADQARDSLNGVKAMLKPIIASGVMPERFAQQIEMEDSKTARELERMVGSWLGESKVGDAKTALVSELVGAAAVQSQSPIMTSEAPAVRNGVKEDEEWRESLSDLLEELSGLFKKR